MRYDQKQRAAKREKKHGKQFAGLPMTFPVERGVIPIDNVRYPYTSQMIRGRSVIAWARIPGGELAKLHARGLV